MKMTLDMIRRRSARHGWSVRHAASLIVLAWSAAACSRLDDILDVAPPANVQTADAVRNQGGAEAVLASGQSQLETVLVGPGYVYSVGGLLTDEYGVASRASASSYSTETLWDTRRTSNSSTGQASVGEPGNAMLSGLLNARSSLLLALAGLQKYEPQSEENQIGKAWALIGYSELFLAETFCAGVPLDRFGAEAGVEYGVPLTTDSLLGVAEAHFDSAVAHANGDAQMAALASVGLGRARLGRKNYAAALSAVASVPTSFVYTIHTVGEYPASNYLNIFPATYSCGTFTIADRDGGTGLDFIRAKDSRVLADSAIGPSCDYYRDVNSFVWYPVQLGNPSTALPLASGVEARLIEAEAQYNASAPTWLATLNTLRTTGAFSRIDTTITQIVQDPGDPSAHDTTFKYDTVWVAGTGGVAHLGPLTLPTTNTAQVNLIFRERAFWLFGTGKRLGDLRRLIRQYGRSASDVFPSGTYDNRDNPAPPFATYGTDVSVSLPTVPGAVSNPNYVGCLTSPGDA